MKTPGKPNINKGLKTGFRPMSLNTSGAVKPVPHTASSPATMNYEIKKRVAGVGATARKPKRMY